MGTVPDLINLRRRRPYGGRRLEVDERFTPRSKKDAETLVRLGIARLATDADTAPAKPPSAAPAPGRPGRPEVVVPAEPVKLEKVETPETPAAGAESKVVDSSTPIGRPRGRPRSSS